MTFPVMAAANFAKDLIFRFIPDKNARLEAAEEIEKMAQSGELQNRLAQISVNQQEAAHDSLFVAGWRPFIGWVCGIGLLYNVLLSPILGIWVEVPEVDPTLLYPVMLGMLGLAGARSYEKLNGVAREK